MSQAEREHWHLDRRVPLALIVALVLQTGGMAWWAATLENRVEHLEEQIATSSSLGERLTRVEERLGNLKEDTANIERYMRQLVYTKPKD